MWIGIGLYGDDTIMNRAREALEDVAGLRIERLRAWQDIRRKRHELTVLVAGWAQIGVSEAREISVIHTSIPHPPIVLVTDDMAGVGRWLSAVPIAKVLAPLGLEKRLPSAILEVATPPVVEWAASELERRGPQLPVVREFLLMSLRAPVPTAQVQQAVRKLSKSGRTLRREWKRGGLGSDPKELLEWIQLMHAVKWRTSSDSWAAAAARLGISTNTLRRLVRRRMDVPPSKLDLERAESEFRTYFRSAFLG